eukprot:764922-Hanusia_phi.AAC.1
MLPWVRRSLSIAWGRRNAAMNILAFVMSDGRTLTPPHGLGPSQKRDSVEEILRCEIPSHQRSFLTSALGEVFRAIHEPVSRSLSGVTRSLGYPCALYPCGKFNSFQELSHKMRENIE